MPKSAKSHIGSLSKRRRENWERRWSKDGFSPFWLGNEFPSEMNEFLEGDWFEPKGRILDIGCGRGELAAGLASRGHTVVGVDFSSAAIRKAKRLYGASNDKLTFKCLDVCGPKIRAEEPFDYLVDRGCLHSIPGALRGAYARNLAALSKPSCKLLIFHKKVGIESRMLLKQVAEILKPDFKEIGFRKIDFGKEKDAKAGLALEFLRPK